MPDYRRAFVPGGCWFFTANLLDRRGSLLTDRIDALREATRRTRQRYCYVNPLKHGLVGRVQDWPFSSFHRDVRAGLFPADWAGEIERPGEFGEA